MVIYDIDGKKLLDAILTESAEHEQELSKSDFVKLSWESDVKLTIPAGSYIVPFEDGLKYRLLNAYTPSETDKGFKYDISFHHPLMWLSRVPFLYVENDLKQQEWSFDGLTVTALEYVCKAINEAFNITDDNKKFTYTLCGTVDGSVSFSVSSNDILSVLSSIAQACKDNSCEWHLSWEHRCLYFGQIAINLGEEVPLLKVHDNIQTASVSESKEDYYNCFYPQGSTKNMSRKAQVGTGNVATLARLGLDTTKYPDGCIYIGTDGKVITKAQFEASNAIKQTLALSFDDIFPHIDLYAYNIRKRTRYLKNDTTGEYELDSKGNKKIYTVWYMRLAYCTTTKDTRKTLVNTTTDNGITHYWYDYDLDRKKQVLQGYELKGTFKVNTHTTNNKYDALTQSLVGQPSGQDGFELYYHEENSHSISANSSEGDSGVSVLKGDYKIKMYQSGDTIIPTNEEDGLIPHGKALPDLTCNIVVLFNIVMGEYETKLAQEELAARTIKTIEDRTKDKNNYTTRSNPVEFARKNPNLHIGQKVTYDDGFGYKLSTRVIKLVTKLDYPIIQEITLGNQAIKGTISQLKEDVSNILSGNFSGGGINGEQAYSIVRNYVDDRFLRKNAPDTARDLITFLKGVILGKDYSITAQGKAVLSSIFGKSFQQGINGRDFGFWTDEKGRGHIETDFLSARVKAVFQSLEIRELSYVGGNFVFSGAGGKIYRVAATDSQGKPTDGEPFAYRCYMIADDGTTRTINKFKIGDQVRCQTFNIKEGVYENVGNRHYWRLCVGTGTEEVDGKTLNYIDLSNSLSVEVEYGGRRISCIGYDEGAMDIPQAGDSIVQEGSQTDGERQSLIMILTEGTEAPAISMYDGVNGYDLSSHRVIHLSPKGCVISSQYLTVQSSSGATSPMVTYLGDWQPDGRYGHYDSVTHDGSTWLCTVPKGQLATEEPSESSSQWKRQVAKGESPVSVQILGGNIIRNGQGSTTLTAYVWKGNEDITERFKPGDFSWTRDSGNPEYDTEWNRRHRGFGRTLTVSAQDVFKRATFDCILTM
ncbi:hypothetical protein [Prevotella sp. HUN102]|uniref:hypothetical protein n=1 Tax=Prevotella sp. HUN102 TaxID=1392486 RepID=UPI000690D73A|nr:hypothetical protein [Prevotella sp. HUN102]